MTVESIQELCPQAENITITPDGTVAMRVGLFAQSVGVVGNKDTNSWQIAVRDLYHDLLGMNRQVQRQEKERRDHSGKA